MKYIDEFRNDRPVRALVRAIRETVTRPWNLMEICGGQTHAIARYRLEELLPPEIRLLHGPGCPVCVTPAAVIDRAAELAARPGTILASFGDMLRVAGNRGDLLQAKARGGDVRMLYAPLDAVSLATAHPDREVVFFAIGFETTAPVHLAALQEAIRRKATNFSLLTSLFTVPPAIEAILSDPDNRVDGFLTAGHVCAVTGHEPYRLLARRYRTPMVTTGFEPADLLYGIYCCVRQLESGRYEAENAYRRAVPETGNEAARRLMEQMLEPCDQEWRGIGRIPASGLKLKRGYEAYSAAVRFPAGRNGATGKPVTGAIPDDRRNTAGTVRPGCMAGAIMRGLGQPSDCPHFGTGCRPDRPLGAPMVSAEGVCAAYYLYKS